MSKDKLPSNVHWLDFTRKYNRQGRGSRVDLTIEGEKQEQYIDAQVICRVIPDWLKDDAQSMYQTRLSLFPVRLLNIAPLQLQPSIHRITKRLGLEEGIITASISPTGFARVTIPATDYRLYAERINGLLQDVLAQRGSDLPKR